MFTILVRFFHLRFRRSHVFSDIRYFRIYIPQTLLFLVSAFETDKSITKIRGNFHHERMAHKGTCDDNNGNKVNISHANTMMFQCSSGIYFKNANSIEHYFQSGIVRVTASGRRREYRHVNKISVIFCCCLGVHAPVVSPK